MGSAISNLAYLALINAFKLILCWIIGSIHSYKVWEQIHYHFFSQTKAHAQQLCTDLRVTFINKNYVNSWDK